MKTMTKLILPILAAIITMLGSSTVFAAARIASVTGNWNATATWGGSSVPGSGDTVTINSGITVTVTADAACSSLTFLSTATVNSTVTINSGITLAVSGAITLPRGNNGVNTVAVGAGILTAGSIAFTSSGGNVRHQVTISTGTVTVTGNVTQESPGSGNTSPTISFSGAGTLKLGGTIWSSADGTLTTFAGSTVEYNAAGAQTLGDFTYNNLTLSGSGAKTFPATLTTTVNGVLSREGTATATVSGTLTYGPAAALQYKGSGAQTTGAEFTTPWAGTGGVKINNASGVTLNAVKTINAATSLTIGDAVANSIFNDGGFQVTCTGTLNLTSGTFKLGSVGTATTWPAFSTRNISPGTTVEYASGVAQVVSPTPSYQNLTLSGAGGKSLASSTTVAGTLTVGSGTTFTPAAGAQLNSAGAAGTIAGSGTIQVTRTAATADLVNQYKFSTYTLSGLTVDYAGLGVQTVNKTATVGNYGGLTTSGASGTRTRTLDGDVTVVGDVTIGVSTTLDVSASNYALSVGGDWANNGTFTARSGTVTFDGTAQALGAATTFYNLTLSGSGTKTPSAGMTVNNTFTIGSGTTFDAGAFTHTVLGGGSVVINGTLDFTSSTGFMRSGTTLTTTLTMGSTGLLRTSDDLGLGPVANASLQTQAGGAWDVSSISTFGTVEYYRNVTSNQAVTDRDYNNLTITGSTRTKTWTITATRTVNGDLTVNASAPLTMSGAQVLNLKGNFSNSGTFTPGTGTVNFNGSGTQNVGGSSTTTFNSVSVASGSALSLALNENTGTLALNSVNKASGTWGATSSGAAHINDTFFSGTAGTLNVTTGVSTTTTVARHTGTVTPSTYGTSLSFDVALSLGSSPSGTLTLKDGGAGGTTIGSAAVTGNGTYTITPAVNALAVGTHANIVAVYSGDDNNNASTSSALSSQVVNALAVTLSGSRTYDGTTVAAASSLTIVNNVDSGNLTLSGSGLLSSKDVGLRTITAAETPVRVASRTGNTGTGTSTTISVSGMTATTAGNTLVAVISTRGTTTSRVSGISGGGTWVRAAQSANANGTTTEIWFAPNISAGVTTVTITQANLRSAAVVIEYSGILTVSPLDQINAASSTGSSTSPVTGTTPTTTQANELWIGGIGYISSTPTLGTIQNSFTSVATAESTSSTASDNANVYALERIVTGAAAASSGGTLSVSAQWSGAVATFKAELPSGTVLALGGSAAGNYTLTGLSGSVDITAKALTVSGITAASTIYDGTTTAKLGGAAAFQSPEAVGAGTTSDGIPYSVDSVSPGSVTGTLTAKDVGTQNVMTSVAVSGTGSGNYTVTPQAALTQQVTQKALTVSGLTATSTVYDGTATAKLGGTAAFQGTEAAGAGNTGDGKPYDVDSVTPGGTAAGTLAARNVGSQAVTITGVTVAGTGNGNYTVTQQTGLSQSVTAKPLTAAGSLAFPASKVYDGTTTAVPTSGSAALQTAETAGTGSTSDGIPYSVDSVGLTGTATYNYNSKDVASASTITVGGLSLTGGANYTLTAPSFTSKTVTAKALTVAGTLSVPASRVYNGTTAATVSGAAALQSAESTGSGTTADGKPYTGNGDVVSLSGTVVAASYNSATVASASLVTFDTSPLSLTGSGSGNYTITAPTQAATITKASTTSGLATSGSPVTPSTSVAFTDTLSATSPGGGTPTGDVSFKEGETTLGTGTLNGSAVATFSTSSLAQGSHVIRAEYPGDANFFGSTNVVTQVVNSGAGNTAPVAGSHFLGAVLNTTLRVNATALSSQDYDADGDTLSVTSVTTPSTQGGTVSLSLDVITYVPPSDYVGSDQFTYAISDGRGGTANCTAVVTVRLGKATSVFSYISGSSGTVDLRGHGIPGRQYDIQISANPDFSSGVSVLTTVTAAANGIMTYTDTTAGSGPRYYRFAIH